jgi:hypothetical protein
MQHPKTEALLAEIRTEFPSFVVRKKRGSVSQWLIDVGLRVVTLGFMRTYLTQYHTVLFGTLWVPDAWDKMSDTDKIILLRHERVHLRQRRRMGDLRMTVQYLFWIFPVGLAYGRARIEWEAYEETIRATAECINLETAKGLKAHLRARFVGPDYGWMWPFPRTIDRWFDAAMAAIEKERQPAKSEADGGARPS